MKNRIQQVMLNRGMSQKEFSRATGISPASLSSIFNGRTAPTIKHADALHRAFKELNMSWLIFGEGEMYGTPGMSGDAPLTGAEVMSAAPNLFSSFTEEAAPDYNASATHYNSQPSANGMHAAAGNSQSASVGTHSQVGGMQPAAVAPQSSSYNAQPSSPYNTQSQGYGSNSSARPSQPSSYNSQPSSFDAHPASHGYEASPRANAEDVAPRNFIPSGEMVNFQDKKQRKIVEIRIFFDDGTFETFKG